MVREDPGFHTQLGGSVPFKPFNCSYTFYGMTHRPRRARRVVCMTPSSSVTSKIAKPQKTSGPSINESAGVIPIVRAERLGHSASVQSQRTGMKASTLMKCLAEPDQI